MIPKLTMLFLLFGTIIGLSQFNQENLLRLKNTFGIRYSRRTAQKRFRS
jgi:hypothetical protein